MKPISILLLIMIVFLQSCGLNDREKKLKQQQEEIVKKEQQLMLWEQQLKTKEQKLETEKVSLDSVKKQIDTTSVYNPAITGKWSVKMSCTETSCDGSAIGDTKTEQWYISYNQNTVMVRAYSGAVLLRVYVGTYMNNTLKIIDEKPNPDALIGATLNFIVDGRMDGTREIRQKECKIVYVLSAKKLK
ncbi:hypothetical protein SAMN04487898_11568 [Pedobacter sp. ok626]|uniref:hypothetical protein n=1 Tax=Pedobacter sp. ok626 TaxID=1761882 RepID=UPI00088F2A8E|nr:hypothetical protein [Pedobacter sp. ok626]SDL12505.1 hypothetical protein SAMN04487898_11568 [Pedobacter sp. ok626]